jgi:hypothetical protein
MVHYRGSGADVSGLLWCGCNPMRFRAEPLTFTPLFFFCFFFAAFAIVVVIVWAQPNLPIPLAVQNGVPWVSLSVSLNIIVTSMICFRLLRMRALLRQVHGPEASSKVYTNTAAMLVESAAPFTILGIGLLVTLAQNGPLLYAFGYIWNVFSVR